jgi:hypothetical protein
VIEITKGFSTHSVACALLQLADVLESDQSRKKYEKCPHAIGISGATEQNATLQMRRVVQGRRVVQIMQILFGNVRYSDAEGIRRSIFRVSKSKPFCVPSPFGFQVHLPCRITRSTR